MSEYVYGYFYEDSDVEVDFKDGKYTVWVGDRHYVADKPMPQKLEDIYEWLSDVKTDPTDFNLLQEKSKWYAIAKRLPISAEDPGYKHEFDLAHQTNAFLLDLRKTGFLVPDWILFKAS